MLEVRLHTTLRKYAPSDGPDGLLRLEFESGLTVGGLLSSLSIGEEEVMLVAINGEIVGRVFENSLHDGDSISLFGLVDGG